MFDIIDFLSKSVQYKAIPLNDPDVISISVTMGINDLWKILKPEIAQYPIDANNKWVNLYNDAKFHKNDLNLTEFYMFSTFCNAVIGFSDKIDMQIVMLRYVELLPYLAIHLDKTTYVSNMCYFTDIKFILPTSENTAPYPCSDKNIDKMLFVLRNKLPIPVYTKDNIMVGYLNIIKITIEDEGIGLKTDIHLLKNNDKYLSL